MTVTNTDDTANSIVLQMSPVVLMSEDSFFDFCQLNSHLRIERSSTGELIIMSPTGSETGNLDILPDLKVRGFQDQAAIALEERLTSPTLREDAPSL